MDIPQGGSIKREHSGADEDWSQHAEADDSQRILSSLRIEAHSEASRPSNSSNDGGDDVDDWSRQNETEHIHRMPSSLIVEDDIDDLDVSRNASINELSSDVIGTVPRLAVDILDGDTTPATGLAPQRSEPTLKEKLVERERQRRAETERARLKRQFALSSNGGSAADDENPGFVDGGGLRENGSVAGTIGDGSTVALVDIEEEEDDQKLTYPMKRFLQEQGNIIEEEEPGSRESPRDVNQGVVMERFLKEPVMVATANDQTPSTEERTNVDRSVSFDMEPISSAADEGEDTDISTGRLSSEIASATAPLSLAQADGALLDTSVDVGTSAAASVANASVTCLPPCEEDGGVGDLEAVSNASALDEMDAHPSSLEVQSELESPSMDRSTSSDQPRFLRLTEAEIQEMAAIDEASRSNAPPSERDTISDSSFVGELVSDFGGHNADNAGTLSQGTPTTAMESASIASGNHSTRPMSEDIDDRNSIDGLATGSISSHVVVSSTGGNVSVTANPPSDIGGDDVAPSLIPEDIEHDLAEENAEFPEANIPDRESVPRVSEIVLPQVTQPNIEAPETTDLQLPDEDCKIVNRMIRPGMVNMKRGAAPGALAPSTPIRRSLSAPDSMTFDVDGFDFDKNAPESPGTSPFGAIRDIGPDDMWSPGSRMSASPYASEKFQNYGTAGRDIATKQDDNENHTTTLLRPRATYNGETEPLMPEIPKEIVASSPRTGAQSATNAFDVAFDQLRCESAAASRARSDDAKSYEDGPLLQRVFSGRATALLVTYMLEVPVLLLITGGSERLCDLIGQRRLRLLVGFILLSGAISGNVGLQSSYYTTRAISHGHVTMKTYRNWLAKELGTSAYLGLLMGVCVGCAALTVSSFDFAFGLAIMIAQFTSIVMAGLSGSLAPVIFAAIFKSDYGKWSGPIETAFQDIVNSVAMITVSYNVMIHLSQQDVDFGDKCT